MTVQEYNKEFLPKIDHANGFICNLEHAMQKTNDYEESMNQLQCIGWDEELKETIKVALEFYRKSTLDNEVDINGDKKTRPMSAYFTLENWLYSQREKPVEIKSAMLWGGLWVVNKMDCIDWNTMRNMYGEFMSKQMGLR